MDDLTFSLHALEEMARDNITVDDVYQVTGDADDFIERDDGRTEYTRIIDDGRQIVVIVRERDRSVRSAWERKRRQ